MPGELTPGLARLWCTSCSYILHNPVIPPVRRLHPRISHLAALPFRETRQYYHLVLVFSRASTLPRDFSVGSYLLSVPGLEALG
jgi:hypothetical protein